MRVTVALLHHTQRGVVVMTSSAALDGAILGALGTVFVLWLFGFLRWNHRFAVINARSLSRGEPVVIDREVDSKSVMAWVKGEIALIPLNDQQWRVLQKDKISQFPRKVTELPMEIMMM